MPAGCRTAATLQGSAGAMHRTAALVAATLALAAPRLAAADRAAPAADLVVGGVTYPGVDSAGGAYARLGGGLQVGRIAAMLHAELFSVSPDDETLDTDYLRGSGLGGSMRVDLQQAPQHYLQIQAGVSFRSLRGDEEVRRACSVFGTCVAGFYLEQPRYTDVAPFVAIGAGVRGKSRIWPGFGGQLGLGTFEIDRPGTGPDSRGVIVWLSAQFVIGGR